MDSDPYMSTLLCRQYKNYQNQMKNQTFSELVEKHVKAL
jgi:hypothetical protein